MKMIFVTKIESSKGSTCVCIMTYCILYMSILYLHFYHSHQRKEYTPSVHLPTCFLFRFSPHPATIETIENTRCHCQTWPQMLRAHHPTWTRSRGQIGHFCTRWAGRDDRTLLIGAPKLHLNFTIGGVMGPPIVPKNPKEPGFFLMDGNGETTIFRVKIPNHPVETTILKWMFPVPGGTQFLAAPVIRVVHKQKLHHGCLAEYIFQLQAKQGFSVFLGLADSKARYFWLLNLHALGKRLAQFSPGKQLPFLLIKSTTASGKMKPKLRHRSCQVIVLGRKFGGDFFCTKSFRNKTDSETWNFGFNWLKNGFQSLKCVFGIFKKRRGVRQQVTRSQHIAVGLFEFLITSQSWTPPVCTSCPVEPADSQHGKPPTMSGGFPCHLLRSGTSHSI